MSTDNVKDRSNQDLERNFQFSKNCTFSLQQNEKFSPHLKRLPGDTFENVKHPSKYGNPTWPQERVKRRSPQVPRDVKYEM